MNKELLFAKTLEKVKEIAADQGNCISEEQVQKEFVDAVILWNKKHSKQ